MSELLYNPFRSRLKIAFPLKSDDYIRNAYNSGDNKDESFEKATLVPAVNASIAKILPEPEEVAEVDRLPYIGFSQFCIYLGVFCPRATSDLKFNCK